MTDPSFKQKLQALVEASTKGPWVVVAEKSPNMTGVHAGPLNGPDSYLLFTLENDPRDTGPVGDGGLTANTVRQWKDDARLLVHLVNAAQAILELLEAAAIAAPFLEGMSEAYRMQGKAYEVPAKVAAKLRDALKALEASNG